MYPKIGQVRNSLLGGMRLRGSQGATGLWRRCILQNSRLVLRTAVLLAAGLSVGCKLGVVPGEAVAQTGLAVTPAQARAANATAFGTPKITGVNSGDPGDGMSHVQVRLTIAQPPAIPKFHLEALPGAWTDALVTLFSATANTGYVSATHSQVIPQGFFFGLPLTGAANFPPLRPANDYVARCFLRNDVGATIPLRLAASQQQTAVTLDAGANTINFTLSLNANESSYSIVAASSSFKNVVSDGYIVKSDQIDFNTGIQANAPGVDHVDAVINGAAYGGGSAILGRITNPANFASFTWNSNVNAVAPGTYLSATLVGGNLALPKTGNIEFRAYHILDGVNDVGKAVIPINIYTKPTVSVSVQ
ncbi:MAG: hypothetical protein JWM80_1174 [Cyanobacteria bacterium RYN_339]|nr:hypothetical protein [Cyanobacteria bacterium RYN_339]